MKHKDDIIKNIIVIIGLPGSGKTTLAHKLNDGSYFLFDDMNKNFHLLEIAQTYENIIITDPALCSYNKQFILDKLHLFFGNSSIQFIAFENDLEQSIINSHKRIDKYVKERYITKLSKEYRPHENFHVVLPVYKG